MDLKHLQALVGIAEKGSFSAAAASLGTVQSNVSAHIARLERELDVILVDRTTGRLTEEGDVVLGRARRMIVELEAIVADVAALRQDVVGTVRAGMIGTTGRWLVPQLLARVRTAHPHVVLHVAEGINTTLDPQLVSGQLDLAVMTLPTPGDELITTPLFEEDLCLVVPASHPLVAEYGASGNGSRANGTNGAANGPGPSPVVPLAVLSQLDLLLPLPGTALRDEIDAAVVPAGITLRPAMELDGLRLLASLTFDGHGPAILPATAVPEYLRDRFWLLPLEGRPRRQVGVALRSRGMPSAPTRAIIALLHAVVSDADTMPPGLHPAVDVASGRGSRS